MSRWTKLPLALALLTLCLLLAGCGGKSADGTLADGEYTVAVDTGSTMFHLNESCHGKGTLTVKNGEMTVHLTLTSKSIVHLYPGTAEEAKAPDTALIDPTVDTVTYDDGITEEVYGFDVPVPALDEPFPCAIIGTHGNWYDHQVTVSHPQ